MTTARVTGDARKHVTRRIEQDLHRRILVEWREAGSIPDLAPLHRASRVELHRHHIGAIADSAANYIDVPGRIPHNPRAKFRTARAAAVFDRVEQRAVGRVVDQDKDLGKIVRAGRVADDVKQITRAAGDAARLVSRFPAVVGVGPAGRAIGRERDRLDIVHRGRAHDPCNVGNPIGIDMNPGRPRSERCARRHPADPERRKVRANQRRHSGKKKAVNSAKSQALLAADGAIRFPTAFMFTSAIGFMVFPPVFTPLSSKPLQSYQIWRRDGFLKKVTALLPFRWRTAGRDCPPPFASLRSRNPFLHSGSACPPKFNSSAPTSMARSSRTPATPSSIATAWS